MKKSLPIFLCFVLVTSLSFSQISFTEHVITNNYDKPYLVYATDLDKDGDIDVLATSNDNDTLYWYKNMGNQNFQKTNIRNLLKTLLMALSREKSL